MRKAHTGNTRYSSILSSVLTLLSITACHGGSFPATAADQRPPVGAGLPCGVADALRNRCQQCHAAEPVLGAPMALTAWDDLQKPSPSDPNKLVWEAVQDRMRDEMRPMPPPPFPPLEAEEVRALDSWLSDGAPQSSATCGPSRPVPPPPDMEDGNAPCTPSETYVAHGPLAPEDGFPVPGRGDHGGDVTVCFRFVRPVGAASQAIAWRPVLDDKRVVHHINVYATPDPIEDGTSGPCRFDNATYLMGWEPGRPNTMLPEYVGLEMPARGSRGIILEVHYHNAFGYHSLDRSGMAICTTDTPRPYTAGVLTAGTKNIAVPARENAEATGLCPASVTGAMAEPLHVLNTAPHMHAIGKTLQTEVVHADGSVEMLAPPTPWDPAHQPLFQHLPAVDIRPGDMLRTTCKYTNPADRPVLFGPRAVDEMCYSFNLVYPITALPTGLNDAPLRLCDCPSGDNCGF
jgi:copper type II ascorbate-dependent monooxygenase-like protein